MVKRSGKERRGYVRARRILSIQFRLKKSSRKGAERGWHLTTTHNMSVGGIGFFTDADLRKGEIIEIIVTMSGLLEIYKGLARIMRVEKKTNAAHFYVAVKLSDVPLPKRSAKVSEETPKKRSFRNVKRI